MARTGLPHNAVPQMYNDSNLYAICKHYGETERERKIIERNSGKPYILQAIERNKNGKK